MKKCLYCEGSGIQDNLGWDLPKYCPHCDGEGYVSNVKWVYQKLTNQHKLVHCHFCGETIKLGTWQSRPIEDRLHFEIRKKDEQIAVLTAELASRDEQIAEAEEYYQACMTIAILCEQAGIPNPDGTTVGIVKSALAELARRDETISRLKEDAERFVKEAEHKYYCDLCSFSLDENGNGHAPDCPVILHRALMKELE